MSDLTEVAALVGIVAAIAGVGVGFVRYVHGVQAKINDRMDKRVADLHRRVDETHAFVDQTRTEFVTLREFTQVVDKMQRSIDELRASIDRHEQNNATRMERLIAYMSGTGTPLP